MSTILEIQNVSKKYGSFKALNNISLKIKKGSIFGLLGPNGAGKTSLIRIINQITFPDKGTVLLNGEPLQAHHISNIGYLPEERGLYKSMKVKEQLIYLGRLKGLTKTEANNQLKYWFSRLNINNWENKKIEELSKGQAQKIQFIGTVMHKPKLLIFDEPFSGFDPVTANLIKDEILELRRQGATIIFSTHRMESVEELCDEIALINNASKILDGKLIDIKQQFKTKTYEIGVNNFDSKGDFFEELKLHYKVLPASFKNLKDDIKFNVKLNDTDDPHALLRFLNERVDVNHFVEIIPSVNDIFINCVNN
jgi:ABC-2 type transport system ATP-binding protein